MGGGADCTLLPTVISMMMSAVMIVGEDDMSSVRVDENVDRHADREDRIPQYKIGKPHHDRADKPLSGEMGFNKNK